MDYRDLKAQDRETYELPAQSSSRSLVEKLSNLPGRILNKFSIKTKLALQKKVELIRKLDYVNHDIYLRVTSIDEEKRLRACEKEPWTVQWLETYLKPGEVLFDIGANVGAYSLVAAKFMQDKGTAKVFAYEPSFSTFSSLCQNIILNNCQDSITPFQVAFASQTSIATFNYHTLEAGSALHFWGESEQLTATYRQQVLSYAMDDFIKEFHLPIPNHIKLDVDGSELAILQGAEQTLSHKNLRSLMIELNEDKDKSDEKIVDFLASKQFQLHDRYLRISVEGIRRPYSYCVFMRANN